MSFLDTFKRAIFGCSCGDIAVGTKYRQSDLRLIRIALTSYRLAQRIVLPCRWRYRPALQEHFHEPAGFCRLDA